MNKKFKLFDKSFRVFCALTVIFISISIILLFVTVLFFHPSFLMILISILFCDSILIYVAGRHGFIWLKIDEKTLGIKCVFGTIKKIKWDEIKDIFVFNFEGTESIKAGQVNLGGIMANVPKVIPPKWIFVDEGNGESGENIFEYFIPQRKNLPIRLQYDEKIMIEIKRNYSKTIIEKTIH